MLGDCCRRSRSPVLPPPFFSVLLETCTIWRTSKGITISSVNPNPEVQKNWRRKHRTEICDNNHPKSVRLIISRSFYLIANKIKVLHFWIYLFNIGDETIGSIIFYLWNSFFLWLYSSASLNIFSETSVPWLIRFSFMIKFWSIFECIIRNKKPYDVLISNWIVDID